MYKNKPFAQRVHWFAWTVHLRQPETHCKHTACEELTGLTQPTGQNYRQIPL